jgi:hypothetical protein
MRLPSGAFCTCVVGARAFPDDRTKIERPIDADITVTSEFQGLDPEHANPITGHFSSLSPAPMSTAAPAPAYRASYLADRLSGCEELWPGMDAGGGAQRARQAVDGDDEDVVLNLLDAPAGDAQHGKCSVWTPVPATAA